MRCLLKRNFHAVAQIGPAIHPRAAVPTSSARRATAACLAEDVAENVAERLGKPAKTLRACSGRARIDARMPVLIVGRALLRIREHFVGLFDLLETLFRVLAVRIAVRVVLHRKLAISLLDLVAARIFRDTHNLVVIPFRHIGSAPLRSINVDQPGGSRLCLESRDSCGLSTSAAMCDSGEAGSGVIDEALARLMQQLRRLSPSSPP